MIGPIPKAQRTRDLRPVVNGTVILSGVCRARSARQMESKDPYCAGGTVVRRGVRTAALYASQSGETRTGGGTSAV